MSRHWKSQVLRRLELDTLGIHVFVFGLYINWSIAFFFGEIYLGDWAFTDRKWGYQNDRKLGMYETIEEYFHTLPIFTNQNGKVIRNTTCLVVAAPRCTLQIHMKLSINHQRFHIDAFFTRGFGRAKSSYRNRAILQDCWTSTRISHVS